MSEYIERDAAIKAVTENDCEGYATWAIKSIPAADVMPVVRCKDCTHSRKGKASLECEKHAYVWDKRLRWVDDNDFCCWGVRKDGDGE